jgi:hypothetical protein
MIIALPRTWLAASSAGAERTLAAVKKCLIIRRYPLPSSVNPVSPPARY